MEAKCKAECCPGHIPADPPNSTARWVHRPTPQGREQAETEPGAEGASGQAESRFEPDLGLQSHSLFLPLHSASHGFRKIRTVSGPSHFP